jgi:hypothetical protein
MPHVTRIAGSLVSVLIAYWLYLLLAVPWIEPPADPPYLGAAADPTLQDADPRKWQMEEIAELFRPGDWELAPTTIVLEGNRAKLLLKKYTNGADGAVEINPCTIVFANDGAAEDEAQRRRQAIVLQPSDGALLQLDRPLNPTQPRPIRLRGGQFRGVVTIRSNCKQPGPEDDLRIVTKNVTLTEQLVSTPEPVEFCWGRNYGRGRDMQIKLLPGPPNAGDATGMNVGGIESFELHHLDFLHLDLEQTVFAAGKPPPAGAKPGTVPVDIRCDGPFQFDAVRRVATFHDHVVVTVRESATAPDQIVGELLSLYFIERAAEKPTSTITAVKKKKDNAFDLVPERLEVRGAPAVVTAPCRELIARAARIEYNLASKSIALDGELGVFLRHELTEIQARTLYGQLAGENRLGAVTSQGPGSLRTQSREHPEQRLEAAWRDQLLVRPRNGQQEVRLTGGARLGSVGVGQIEAREIFFWVLETPPISPGGQFKYQPHAMSARKDVQIDSPQLSGRVAEQLDVWFEEGAGGGARGTGGSTAASVQPGPATNDLAPVGAPAGPSAASAQPNAQSHFHVVGRKLQARALLAMPQAKLSDLLIEDGVDVVETQTAKPDDQPVRIQGDRLEVKRAAEPNTAMSIVGRPARFEGRGLGLTGLNINLDRGENRLWIDDAGRMELPIAADLEGKPLPAPGTLTVVWRRGMTFDGVKAKFEGSVVATGAQAGDQYQVRSETMEVLMQQPVRFSEMKSEEQPKPESIHCFGGVDLEGRKFDAQQQLAFYLRMHVNDLGVNLSTGALNGSAGWLNAVSRPSGDSPAAAFAPAGTTSVAKDQLSCLHVKFQDSIVGNVRTHRVTFNGQVQTTYAPVGNNQWDAMLTTNNPEQLGPDGAVAHCDELTVVQMPLPTGVGRAAELYAVGNARVEGVTFRALASRITYAQAKDLLTLQGDGRNLAQLFRFAPGVAPEAFAAQQVFYWTKTKRVKTDGLQLLEVPIPQGKTK